MNNFILSNKDRDEIFYTFILPSLINKLESCENPTVHILGGQPATGKSHFIKTLIEQDANMAVISGDDFRGYHPRYRSFLEENELEATDLTRQDVNYWMEKAITEVSLKKYSMVIEGTLREAEAPIKSAKLLSDAGYLVNMEVILINPKISKIDIIKRYLLQKQEIGLARFTKTENHNRIVNKIFENILKIAAERKINCLKIFRREAENYNLLYERNFEINSEYNEADLIQILEVEKNRKLAKEELEYMDNSWKKIIELSEKYGNIKEYIKNIREKQVGYGFLSREFKIS